MMAQYMIGYHLWPFKASMLDIVLHRKARILLSPLGVEEGTVMAAESHFGDFRNTTSGTSRSTLGPGFLQRVG
jgi:hypothetical protein